MSVQILTISDTSPAAASTVVGATQRGLRDYNLFSIDAALLGATGGTLDVYLQRLVGDPLTSTTWVDWLHFPQLAAGASAIRYSVQDGTSTAITLVGTGTTPALAANTFIGGHPGSAIRALYVAGASTTAGAVQVITINAWRGLGYV